MEEGRVAADAAAPDDEVVEGGLMCFGKRDGRDDVWEDGSVAAMRIGVVGVGGVREEMTRSRFVKAIGNVDASPQSKFQSL